ncbi:amidohydrolase family protein [Aquabacter sp. CN5-332]|uniref:amidohydrolase family protein n=1 Tax=Aquabacter sp. CN5-332 TaxID=3156608 RepID=UPI0032B4909A
MKTLAFSGRLAGAIDCDVHNAVPSVKVLYPYLSEYWQDFMAEAGHPSLEPNYYPVNSAIAARPEARGAGGPPGADPDALISLVLDQTGAKRAILNCLYGVQALYNEYWAGAMATAVNDWLADQWLDRDPRLSASIIVAPQNPAAAVEEIERRAADSRFVQVLLPARTQMPLGRRYYWPIYEAAARHKLPVCIHAGGGGGGNPPTPVGWPTYYVEEYLAVAQGFQGQLVSLLAEGVFAKVPDLKVVFAESGFTWLPSLLWRLDKNWKGLRREVPWVDRLPSEIIREHLKITLQPLDEPDELRRLVETIDHIQSDQVLLFSSDYPHWQFDEEGPLPMALSPEAERNLLFANAERTYRFHA